MKTQLSKPSRTKARYSEEYKQEALELWRNSGRSLNAKLSASEAATDSIGKQDRSDRFDA
jgi:hypothetical protein